MKRLILISPLLFLVGCAGLLNSTDSSNPDAPTWLEAIAESAGGVAEGITGNPLVGTAVVTVASTILAIFAKKKKG